MDAKHYGNSGKGMTQASRVQTVRQGRLLEEGAWNWALRKTQVFSRRKNQKNERMMSIETEKV